MSFANALKKKSEEIMFSVKQPVIVRRQQQQQPTEMLINVERVLNRNRIDVFFSMGTPNAELVNLFMARNWTFRHEDKAWFNADTYDNRLFCEHHLGASFDNMGEAAKIEAPIAIEAFKSEIIDSVTLTNNQYDLTDTPLSPFDRYKQQCNELVAFLGCEMADLGLIAINHLHKSTFSKDS